MKSIRKLVSLGKEAVGLLAELSPVLAREFGIRQSYAGIVLLALKLLARKYGIKAD